MNFISSLVDALIKNEHGDFQCVKIILPSKRAQQKLYWELAHRFNRPVFAPIVLSIDEFVHSLSPLRLASQSELLIDLFHVYKHFPFSQEDDFQHFISWGVCFLHDINEIDLYSCDPDAIFTNLSEFKELEFFAEPNLTPNQRKYLEFYASLKDVYHQFVEYLQQHGKAYNGMIYRQVAQNIAACAAGMENVSFYFAGLHALAPTEMTIAQYLSDHAQVHFAFDLDPFYLNSENNKIGQFINDIQKNLNINNLQILEHCYENIPKHITVTGVSRQMSQVYLAIEALNKMSDNERNKTAVVFADENLLMPFVHAYQGMNANVTMSYPVQYTLAHQLLQDLLSAAQNLRRLHPELSGASNLERAGFYYRDVLAIFRNGIIWKALFPDENTHSAFVEKIIASNRIFLRMSELRVDETDVFPHLGKDGMAFLEELSQFFEFIIAKLPAGNDQSLLIALRQSFDEIRQLFDNVDVGEIDLATLQHFIDDEISQSSLSFVGNPDSGLQLMGLLETRALDFDNVIMLSVNEGVIPTGKSANSLLLLPIRRAFGLPTYEKSDAIYSYHFFRLLQRAKKVQLFYNMDSTGSVAEESRFIRILEFEARNQNLNSLHIERRNFLAAPNMKQTQGPFSIKKDEKILERLRQMRYSASSLNRYINCPLQFYLNCVAGIKPETTIDENIEMNVIGTVMHGILEELFDKIKEQPSESVARIHEWQKKIEGDYLGECFLKQEELKGQDVARGKLFLASEVVKRYLQKYFILLENDFSNCGDSVEIVDTEMDLFGKLRIGEIEVNLHGVADLVENVHGVPHIFDYKTGFVSNLTYDELDKVFQDPNLKQVFQLLFYCYLYKNQVDAKQLACAIIGFQAMMKGDDYVLKPKIAVPVEGKKRADAVELSVTDELLADFEAHLSGLLSEIFNPEVDFEAQCDADRCKFCDYRAFCGVTATD